MAAQPPRENFFLTVLSLAFVAGMGVALGVYLAWSRGLIPPAFQSPSSDVALFFCPPFILSIAVGPTSNADLVLVLVVGTIVVANAFLYAGAAAGIYYIVTLMRKSRRA